MKKEHITILIIVALGLFFQWKYINLMPNNIHAWAQADRLAIAYGFTENGFNFFEPKTYLLNKEFPENFGKLFDSGTTSVDFPIHDYVPALIMGILNTDEPWVFRLYILLMSFLGLFYLYRCVMHFTNSAPLQWFVLIFAASSPLFVYYQGNFLPSIPSLSLAIAGTFYYLEFLKNENYKSFYLAVILFTIAALARLPFATPLIATGAHLFISRKLKLKAILIYALSFATILGYFLYNQHLRELHGSMFLAGILPPTSFEHAKKIIQLAFDKWGFDYFTIYHYNVFLIVIGLFILSSRKTKFSISRFFESKTAFISIYFFGASLYSILMFRQFDEHNYYLLDTFFFPILLVFMNMLGQIDSRIKHFRWQWATSILLIVPAYFMILQASEVQSSRYNSDPTSRVQRMNENFNTAHKLLEYLGYEHKSTPMVFDGWAPNLPFVYLRKDGYNVFENNSHVIANALSWNFDYILIQNEFIYEDYVGPNPWLTKKLKFKGSNGNLSLFELNEVEDSSQSLLEFIQFDVQQISTDTLKNISCENAFCNAFEFDVAESECISLQVNIVKHKNFDFRSQFVVISMNNTFYKAIHLGDNDDTITISKEFLIAPPKQASTLEIYIWNPDKKQMVLPQLAIQKLSTFGSWKAI